MSRLTEKDLAILKARGINQLTTVTDFEIPSYEKKPAKAKKRKSVKAKKTKHAWIGKKIHTSYGYNMTINSFAKIIDVSPTGKTIKCRMVETHTNGQEFGGNGKAKAGNKVYGPEFRLHVRDYEFFVGSYPFVIQGKNKDQCNYRKGFFSFAHNGEYYENHWD